MQPIISIVGNSESGKTNLLEKLIAELKQRVYRAAVVKHSNEDIKGVKDLHITLGRKKA